MSQARHDLLFSPPGPMSSSSRGKFVRAPDMSPDMGMGQNPGTVP